MKTPKFVIACQSGDIPEVHLLSAADAHAKATHHRDYFLHINEKVSFMSMSLDGQQIADAKPKPAKMRKCEWNEWMPVVNLEEADHEGVRNVDSYDCEGHDRGFWLCREHARHVEKYNEAQQMEEGQYRRALVS